MRVYKYRGGNRKIFKRDLFAIEKNYFWGSNFNQLNDPCELLLSSVNFKNQSNKILNFIKKDASSDVEKVDKALDKLITRVKDIGIYSLSKTYKDELLWAHYANSHKGFCIEFDLDLLLESYPSDKVYSFPVKYSNNPPELGFSDLYDKDGNTIVKKLAGNKSKRWEYEREHRIITDKSGEHPYNFKAVKAIYFGLRMPDDWKNKMMNCLKGRGIKYYQIYRLEGKYLFERKEVSDINGSEITYLTQIPRSNTQKNAKKFNIIEKDFDKFNGKATANIELESKLKKDDLIWIANKIREDLFRNVERIFISYKLKHMTAEDTYWAVSNFKGDELEVSINGLTIEQEKLLYDGLKNESRKKLGMWIDETPFVCSSLTLLVEGGETVLETKYSDGSKDLKKLKSTQVDCGIRYDYIEGSDSEEYLIVGDNGSLKYCSKGKVNKELEPFRTK